MRDRDYYPAGAYDDPNAPYNQVDPPEVEFGCRVAYTLERESSLMTDEVYFEGDEETGGGTWAVCCDADLWKAYEWGRKDIPALLAELVKYIDKELDITTDRSRKRELTNMRESAEGWSVVEQDIEIT